MKMRNDGKRSFVLEAESAAGMEACRVDVRTQSSWTTNHTLETHTPVLLLLPRTTDPEDDSSCRNASAKTSLKEANSSMWWTMHRGDLDIRKLGMEGKMER